MSAGIEIDRYRLERELGRGAFGAVYLARHTVLDAPVALKVLLPERVRDDEHAVERFLREARAAAAIGNPHIIRVSDAGTTPDGHAFLAMEVLEGEDLASYLSRRARLHVHDAVELTLQILDGLAAAHDASIVHRDMKPANVFVTTDARGALFAKILDFGVSKMHRSVAAERRLTATGAVIGTPHYMAPEQLMESSTVDARADLYSVGVILYELLTGELPYQAETLGALIKAVMTSTPRPLRELAPEVDGALQSFVLRALAREPAQRFQDAREMAMVLRTARDLGGDDDVDIPATFDGERRVLTRTIPMDSSPGAERATPSSPGASHAGYAPPSAGPAPSYAGYAPPSAGPAPSYAGYAPPSAGPAPSHPGYAPSPRPSPPPSFLRVEPPPTESPSSRSGAFIALAVAVFLCPILVLVPGYLMSDRLAAALDAFLNGDERPEPDIEEPPDPSLAPGATSTDGTSGTDLESASTPRRETPPENIPRYDGREAVIDGAGLTIAPARARPGPDGRWYLEVVVTIRAAGEAALTYQLSELTADGYASTAASDFPTIGMMAPGRSTSGTIVYHAVSASPDRPASFVFRYHGWARQIPVDPGP